jgi:hypothetical protein
MVATVLEEHPKAAMEGMAAMVEERVHSWVCREGQVETAETGPRAPAVI